MVEGEERQNQNRNEKTRLDGKKASKEDKQLHRGRGEQRTDGAGKIEHKTTTQNIIKRQYRKKKIEHKATQNRIRDDNTGKIEHKTTQITTQDDTIEHKIKYLTEHKIENET